ncbi:MAG: polysaccharide deacetylase family protein [Dorea formicigenerans]
MSKFRDEDEFNIDEDQRYAFGEDYDLDDEDSGLDDDEDYEDYDLDEDYNLDDDYIDYGTEAEDSERYSGYDEDNDWISHENRRIHGNHSKKKSDDLKGYDSRSERHETLKNHRKRKKRNQILILAACLVLACLVLTGILKFAGVIGVKTEVTLKADKIEIQQNSQNPVNLTATATSEDEKKAAKVWLDKKKGYSVADFINELRAGKNYEISTDAKTDTEGKYKITIKMNSDIQKKLENEWKHKVRLTVEGGTFVVTNPTGTWDGDKFKKYDGTYVMNDFVVSKGKTYYFDADGNKVAGKQTINNATYFFNKDGVMQTGWKKTDDGTYYLGDNGAAVIGWQTIEEDDYYFDNSGIMATGEVQVGLAKCTFSKKGKLKSKGDVNIDASKPMVALTFDDGPGERTGELLAQLEKYNAHATFFMQGKNIPGKEDFVKKMKETGCELGNHSYDHPQLTKLSADKIANQIGTTNDLIQQAAGSTATVMRPPYGAINDTVRASVGLPMILWSIDTLDWKTRNAQSSIDTVMNDVQDGDVILMHDIHTESIDAALVLIPKLEEAGYQLVTVSEMAKAKGVALQNGEKYVDFWAKDVEKYKSSGSVLTDTSSSSTSDVKSEATSDADSSKKSDSTSSKNSSSSKKAILKRAVRRIKKVYIKHEVLKKESASHNQQILSFCII